jgi:hypothetical protein
MELICQELIASLAMLHAQNVQDQQLYVKPVQMDII